MKLIFKWAYGMMLSNKKRTLSRIALLGSIITIILLCLNFITGTGKQMSQSIRNIKGDINISSKINSINIVDYEKKLNNKNIKTIVKEMEFDGYAYGIGNSQIDVKIIGTEDKKFDYFKKSVSWKVKPENKFARNTILLEAGVASNLNLNKGDFITIKIITEDGMINTIDLEVTGIFVGSTLFFEKTVYMNIEDMNLLYLEDNFVNNYRLYFDSSISLDNKEKMEIIYKNIKKEIDKKAIINSVVLFPSENWDIGFFNYYKIIVVFLLNLLVITFLIVLRYSMKNMFYINFLDKRSDITTLLTYGMKLSKIKLIFLIEGLMLFISSLFFGFIFSEILQLLIGLIKIKSYQYADLITAIGGPNIVFATNIKMNLIYLFIIAFFIVVAVYKGISSCFKMEIRELLTRID